METVFHPPHADGNKTPSVIRKRLNDNHQNAVRQSEQSYEQKKKSGRINRDSKKISGRSVTSKQ